MRGKSLPKKPDDASKEYSGFNRILITSVSLEDLQMMEYCFRISKLSGEPPQCSLYITEEEGKKSLRMHHNYPIITKQNQACEAGP